FLPLIGKVLSGIL
uniref:Temporin-1Tf n=1 Tax=Rana temporaria TaxID=8407 RepID=TPF_RANTE|nr:RecName: Full=Temporin-1Tf; Short=TF; AltName: Full=Temporin-F [Rana temporaria]